MRCPSFENLLNYLDGKLADADAARVAAHLNGDDGDCPRCAAERQWYTEVRRIAATDETVEPPAWVMKRALRIFETQRPHLLEQVVGRVKDGFAALVFDSLARPAVAGVRATETANRQLLYRAGDYSLDLQIAPAAASGVELLGQVLREGETTFDSVAHLSVEIWQGERKLHEALTNDLGEFQIASLAPGVYDLCVHTAAGSITARAVPVQPAA